jgi:hypothetical protein
MFQFDAELEFLLSHPFSGGAPDEDAGDEGKGADSQVEGAEGQDDQSEGERASSDKGDQPPSKDGKWIPKHRFDEVNQGYTKYKGFGTPEQIKQRLDRLAELEALPQNRLNDKEKGEIRKELLHVFPELQSLLSQAEVSRQSYTERGAALNDTFLKEVGIEVNEATNRYLQELLSGIIAADEKLLRRFYSQDMKVFEEAFAVAKKTFWPNVKKFTPGATVQAIKTAPSVPSKQKGGEEKPEKKEGEPLSRLDERNVLDKASEEAFALLEANRSE